MMLPDSLDCQAVLALYPRPFQAVPRAIVRVTGGFSGAVVFHVESAVGPMCLRAWPPSSGLASSGLPAARIRGLHRLLESVHRRGVTSVAVPIADRHGETLVDVQGRPWQLEPWLSGAADFRQRPSEARLRNAMEVLARWHRAGVEFAPRPTEREWFASVPSGVSPAVVERRRKIEAWLQRETESVRRAIAADGDGRFPEVLFPILRLFDEKVARVAGELDEAREWQVPLQPCLRDIWHDHVLFEGDVVSGIIDPSACRTESVAGDLARLLGSLVGDDSDSWRFALSQYSAVRPLSDTERRLIAVLDQSAVLLSGLTWIERRYFRGMAFMNADAVLRRLENIRERLQRL